MTEVQRNTPPFACGVPFAIWMARHGVQWSEVEVAQHYQPATEPEKVVTVKQQAPVAAPLFAEVTAA